MYCSERCRAADWEPGPGQGHRTWCALACGEEHVDWEVRPVMEGKGLGLVAKTPFARGARIMVERLLRLSDVRPPAGRPEVLQAVQALMPAGAPVETKFQLNQLGGDDPDDPDGGGVCVRMSRANHRCGANAYHTLVHDVKLLLARVPIAAGEEICIEYRPFLDPSRRPDREQDRRILEGKWGVVCPGDCQCRRADLLADWQRMWELDTAIMEQGRMGRTGDAFAKVKALLRLHDRHQSAHVSYIRTLYDGVSMAVTTRKLFPEAKRLAAAAYGMALAAYGPDSPDTRKYERLRSNIASHPNYLTLGLS